MPLSETRERALWAKCQSPTDHPCEEFRVILGSGAVIANGGRCWVCKWPDAAHDLYHVLTELRRLRGDEGDPT